MAEGWRGLPLERQEIVASPGKWQEWSREAVHYCLCAGAEPLMALGRAEYINSFYRIDIRKIIDSAQTNTAWSQKN